MGSGGGTLWPVIKYRINYPTAKRNQWNWHYHEDRVKFLAASILEESLFSFNSQNLRLLNHIFWETFVGQLLSAVWENQFSIENTIKIIVPRSGVWYLTLPRIWWAAWKRPLQTTHHPLPGLAALKDEVKIILKDNLECNVMRYLQFTFELFSMLKIMNMQHSPREGFYAWKQQEGMFKAVQRNLVQVVVPSTLGRWGTL